MTWDLVVIWLVIAINLATALLNEVNRRNYNRRKDADAARLASFANCVAMVAFLARPESGSPEPLRAACASLVPPDVRFEIHTMPPTKWTH